MLKEGPLGAGKHRGWMSNAMPEDKPNTQASTSPFLNTHSYVLGLIQGSCLGFFPLSKKNGLKYSVLWDSLIPVSVQMSRTPLGSRWIQAMKTLPSKNFNHIYQLTVISRFSYYIADTCPIPVKFSSPNWEILSLIYWVIPGKFTQTLWSWSQTLTIPKYL